MTKEELTKTRVQLYKPTPSQLQLVDELANTIKTLFDNVETTSVDFKKAYLKLDDNMSVKSVEIDPQEISNVLIHWYPQFDKSNTSDPFCSAYILTPKEIRKIIKTLQNVKDYYQQHNKV